MAISIPIFTGQLEKSRDAVSVANLRSAYAQAQTAVLTASSDDTAGVTYTAATSTTTGPTVKVENVAIKSQKSTDKWSGLANELPWVGGTFTDSSQPADPGDPGNYDITFTYDSDLAISGVSLAKHSAKAGS